MILIRCRERKEYSRVFGYNLGRFTLLPVRIEFLKDF